MAERPGDGGASADGELEVSRLDADRSRGAGDDGGVQGDDPVVSAPTSPDVSRLTSRRRRVMGAMTAGAAVALVLVVVLATIPSGGTALGTLLGTALGIPTPQPTATLAVGANIVELIDSVPWGTLTVDGRERLTYYGILPPLARGKHALVYTAAPFPTLRCQLSVPAAAHDSCPLSATPSAGAVRAVDLQATLDHLPSAAHDALLEAVHAMVAQLVIPDGHIELGDHYQSHSNAIVAASEPLTAHSQVALAAPPPGFLLFGEACNPMCVAPRVELSAPWELIVPITEALQLTDAHGTIVDTVPIDVSGHNAPPPLLYIETQWTGAWSVRLAISAASVVADNLCASGESQLQQLLHPSPAVISSGTGPSTEPAAGCLIRATLGISSSNTASAYLFFARYGVLMAADDATQRALPQLARPSPNERALIAQLAI